MKRRILLGVLLVCLTLAGCAGAEPEMAVTTAVTETVSAETTVPETAAPETLPAETERPEHSALYIPGLDVEDVIRYFGEVCLDAEYYTEGDPSVLQKWVRPIEYAVAGSPTEEDLQVLAEFANRLNEMEGFPGMVQVEQTTEASLRIYFCDAAEMQRRMGDSFVNMDGAVTFWYDARNYIYDAIICLRTDLDQELRNSVILEEVYNGLGPVQDSLLRPDSIISADYSQPEKLTEMDELILRLLYHPDMECGMTPGECEAVIRRLYW